MRRGAGVRPRRVARLGLLLSLMGSVSAAAAPARLKVFVSVDMEGIAGVVIERQTGSEGHDYPIHREQMLAEANAAVAGAFDAGATEVVVLDSHGNGMNLRPDLLDPRARLISGTPRPWGMVAGLDGTFDAMVFIGYHASGSIPDGVLAHTFNLSALSVRLNGQVVGEGGLNAAVGGHFRRLAQEPSCSRRRRAYPTRPPRSSTPPSSLREHAEGSRPVSSDARRSLPGGWPNRSLWRLSSGIALRPIV
jgi:hypothetical protein